MSNNKTESGINFSGLLLVAFIVLKLCKVIDWSWWWVLSPAWIPAAIAIVILIIWVPGWIKERRKIKKHFDTPKSKWQQRIDEMKSRSERRS